ncbi:hypothetical protein A3H75_01290 [Candidatus Uhrbacteria bacterium RIFCSPLOWO2_02_FULL_51_9]|uniref:DUF4389 domain-containing protein n=1 Tax=Candidatus Uhrbacteria bacterium RIFCSPLOWO2_02_FULL_51_9 TaxID=1802410 RepID=A0A1F7VH64_9BACT|nr:MAG: hypothetical protein A3H75_01290 [Candidatus Uhrbacteria bacterium RIFCSPLOWO2_02_FULL_51_9]
MEPIRIDISMEERASRLKLFTRFFWLMVLIWPIYIWAIFVSVVQLLHWWAILFTGRYIGGLWKHQAKFFVYVTRFNAWLCLLTDRRPYLFKQGDSGPTVKK